MLPPIHLAAAREDDAFYAGNTRGFHDVIQANDVVWQKLCEKIRVVRRGGEMDEARDAAHRAINRGAVGEVADGAVVEAGRGRAIEAADGVSAPLEFADGCAANAAGGAGNEDGNGLGHAAVE